ncbi:hypothetical protein D3C85_1676250 [compost metagenome]
MTGGLTAADLEPTHLHAILRDDFIGNNFGSVDLIQDGRSDGLRLVSGLVQMAFEIITRQVAQFA